MLKFLLIPETDTSWIMSLDIPKPPMILCCSATRGLNSIGLVYKKDLPTKYRQQLACLPLNLPGNSCMRPWVYVRVTKTHWRESVNFNSGYCHAKYERCWNRPGEKQPTLAVFSVSFRLRMIGRHQRLTHTIFHQSTFFISLVCFQKAVVVLPFRRPLSAVFNKEDKI